MSAIDELFQRLRTEGRKALMPFITAGDPDLPATAALLRELQRRGCALAELGIPYSDPIADGPVIQASYTRALDKHVKLKEILATLQATPLEMPVVTMVSYAIILRHGLRDYVQAAKAAGAAGAIVPDLLVEEAGDLRAVCEAEDFSLIQLVTPTTPRERALRIAESSSGFLYYVSVTGITGERTQLPAELTDNVAWLRERTALPICIGFGISQAEHVRLLSPVADGLIVGSAIMRRIEAAGSDIDKMIADVGEYVGELQAALDGSVA
ncbi:MAG: tryptophan synthase subunit alpha [Planctomycetales bacterium]|nr:tryptophan synthase subunit alpha [Planctomycetales bacterium]